MKTSVAAFLFMFMFIFQIPFLCAEPAYFTKKIFTENPKLLQFLREKYKTCFDNWDYYAKDKVCSGWEKDNSLKDLNKNSCAKGEASSSIMRCVAHYRNMCMAQMHYGGKYDVGNKQISTIIDEFEDDFGKGLRTEPGGGYIIEYFIKDGEHYLYVTIGFSGGGFNIISFYMDKFFDKWDKDEELEKQKTKF